MDTTYDSFRIDCCTEQDLRVFLAHACRRHCPTALHMDASRSWEELISHASYAVRRELDLFWDSTLLSRKETPSYSEFLDSICLHRHKVSVLFSDSDLETARCITTASEIAASTHLGETLPGIACRSCLGFAYLPSVHIEQERGMATRRRLFCLAWIVLCAIAVALSLALSSYIPGIIGAALCLFLLYLVSVPFATELLDSQASSHEIRNIIVAALSHTKQG